jgi:hypothetical protein
MEEICKTNPDWTRLRFLDFDHFGFVSNFGFGASHFLLPWRLCVFAREILIKTVAYFLPISLSSFSHFSFSFSYCDAFIPASA